MDTRPVRGHQVDWLLGRLNQQTRRSSVVENWGFASQRTLGWALSSLGLRLPKSLNNFIAEPPWGLDGIRPESLNALDFVGLSWSTPLCNIACISGKVPLEWQTGVLVPLFKRQDQRVCSNYGESHCVFMLLMLKLSKHSLELTGSCGLLHIFLDVIHVFYSLYTIYTSLCVKMLCFVLLF